MSISGCKNIILLMELGGGGGGGGGGIYIYFDFPKGGHARMLQPDPRD